MPLVTPEGGRVSIIGKKYNKKEECTRFYHADSGKLLARLDAKLSQYDWDQLQVLFSFIYSKGEEAGSEQRASEIRIALGLEVEA